MCERKSTLATLSTVFCPTSAFAHQTVHTDHTIVSVLPLKHTPNMFWL